MKLAIIGIKHNNGVYWGTYCTVFGEKQYTVRTEDPEGDLIDVLQHAHLQGYLLSLSNSIEEYENAAKGVREYATR
jgi:hypothetical protein